MPSNRKSSSSTSYMTANSEAPVTAATSVKQQVEEVLINVHKALPPTASQAEFHLKVMESLDKTINPEDVPPQTLVPSPPPTPGGFIAGDAEESTSNSPRSSELDNKSLFGTESDIEDAQLASADPLSGQKSDKEISPASRVSIDPLFGVLFGEQSDKEISPVSQPALHDETSDAARSPPATPVVPSNVSPPPAVPQKKIIRRRRRQGNVFREDIVMGVRGNAAVGAVIRPGQKSRQQPPLETPAPALPRPNNPTDTENEKATAKLKATTAANATAEKKHRSSIIADVPSEFRAKLKAADGTQKKTFGIGAIKRKHDDDDPPARKTVRR